MSEELAKTNQGDQLANTAAADEYARLLSGEEIDPAERLSQAAQQLGNSSIRLLTALAQNQDPRVKLGKNASNEDVLTMQRDAWMTVPTPRILPNLGKSSERVLQVTDARYTKTPEGKLQFDEVSIEVHAANRYGGDENALPDPHNFYDLTIGLDKDGKSKVSHGFVHRNGMGTQFYPEDFGAVGTLQETNAILDAAVSQVTGQPIEAGRSKIASQ